MNEIKQAKLRGEYRLAGQLARLAGFNTRYGYHYGSRIVRDYAIGEYQEGWREIDEALEQ